jgi:tRNA A-37 threonylcarbamoyl transferase component Bud32|tara:strand:+ start:516 stop:2018 length:1503 start_codon:yes stop_codon:yes gene_type:complete
VNTIIFLDKNIKELFSHGDIYEIAKNIEGKIYRQTANRITKEFNYKGKNYFIKYHGGIGWKEVFKNLFKLTLPTIGAKREWKAINRLNQLNIKCPEVAAVCFRGLNPANSESFLITKSLINTISLEEALQQRRYQSLTFKEKKEFIIKIADISKAMHDGGVNHRDYYLCHFHIDKRLDIKKDIYLIDLHRAQIRTAVPSRWSEKDIGGLFHSALGFDLTERDLYRFLSAYFKLPIREILYKKQSFVRNTVKRAFSMYMKPLLKEISFSYHKKQPFNSDLVQGDDGKSRWIAKKEFFTKEMREVIINLGHFMKKGSVVKDEAGHQIVKINIKNQEFFIKKYQKKNLFHILRKFFSKTRAYNSWLASYWLRAAGINTFEIACVYEEYNALTTLDSYIISESLEGLRLDEASKYEENSLMISAKIHALFKRLLWIGFNHGDAKSSNFFFSKNSLITFDLDNSRQINLSFFFKRSRARDVKRILRSFLYSDKIYSFLDKRLNNS